MTDSHSASPFTHYRQEQRLPSFIALYHDNEGQPAVFHSWAKANILQWIEAATADDVTSAAGCEEARKRITCKASKRKRATRDVPVVKKRKDGDVQDPAVTKDIVDLDAESESEGLKDEKDSTTKMPGAWVEDTNAAGENVSGGSEADENANVQEGSLVGNLLHQLQARFA